VSVQSSKALISIIITTYNNATTIDRAIKSGLFQTYKNIEIIIVDDCSVDKTQQLVSKWEEAYSNIQYHRFNENKGPNSARNKGIELAKGDYIAFLDADDLWYPKKLEKQLQLFSSSSYADLGLVYCGLVKQYPKGFQSIKMSHQSGDVIKDILVHNFVGGASVVLIKREVFDDIGGFDESFYLRKGGSQDYEMWVRIANSYSFDVVEEILVQYFISEDSVSIQSQKKNPLLRIKSRLYIRKKNPDLFIQTNKSYSTLIHSIGPDLIRLGKYSLAIKFTNLAIGKNSLNFSLYYSKFMIHLLSKYPQLFPLWDLPNKIIRFLKSMPYLIKYAISHNNQSNQDKIDHFQI
jgi:glycosyltransferase involved in cell wall biosynthesis